MKRILFTALFSTISVLSFAQKAVEFSINPEIGKKLPVTLLIKTDVEGPQSMIMDMTLNMSLTPTKNENNVFTIDNTTESVKVDIDAGMMVVNYDSQMEPKDEISKAMASQFGKLIGQTIITKVDNKGKTLDVQLPEDMLQGIDKETFTSMTPSLPATAVKPGDTWTTTNEINNEMIGKMELISTYKEETDLGYVVDITGKIFNPSNSEIGSLSGTYLLDKTTHFTKESKLKSTFELKEKKIISDITATIQ